MPVMIRCHPWAPVPATEIEHWLERELARVRDEAPGATVRLLRLTQELPSGAQSAGWLVELGVDPDVLGGGFLSGLLGEMRLLGLQPTVLENTGLGELPQHV